MWTPEDNDLFELFRKILFVFLTALAVCVPAGYAIVRGQSELTMIMALGLLLLAVIMRSEYRLPVILMYVCVMAADSNQSFLHSTGLTLRWAVLGVLVFKELSYWAFSKQIKVRLTAVHLFFFLFLVYALASSVYSVNPDLTFKRAGSVILFYIVVFVYLWRQTETSQTRVDFVSFAAKLIPLIYLIEVVFSVLFPALSWKSGRLSGISGNPNGLGQMVMITIPFLYWYLLSGKIPKMKIYFVLSILLGFGLLYLSASRGAFLGFGVCLLVITFKMTPKYFVASLAVVMLVCAFDFAYGLHFFKEIESIESSGGLVGRLAQGDLGGREEAWSKALTLGLREPIKGHGFGTAMETFGKLNFKKHYGGYPHNFIFHVFVDLGFVGVVMIVILHLLLLRCVFAALSRQTMKVDYGIPVLAAGIYFAGLFNAFFESWMFSAGSPTAFPFWVMSMLVVRYAYNQSRYGNCTNPVDLPGTGFSRHDASSLNLLR